MKIAFASDLHLDFYNTEYYPSEEFFKPVADVLVLAGDIAEVGQYPRIMDFFRKCSENYPIVLLITGNHEYYGSEYHQTNRIIDGMMNKFDNIHFMYDSSLEIDDTTFIGSTLWTSIGSRDPISMACHYKMMNDYHQIQYNDRILLPKDTVQFHDESITYIREKVAKNNKVVVITHHAPCSKSIHPDYRKSDALNDFYFTELSEFILDNEQIRLWIHGHVHYQFDYQIGETRIVSNVGGYPGEMRRNNRWDVTPKIVEI